MKNYKKMPDEWENIMKEGIDGYLKFDYTACALSDIDDLKKEVNTLKKDGNSENNSPKAKAKAKSKS